MVRREATVLGALALVLLATPIVDAEHCATSIAAYGRAALTPGVVPPPLGRVCFSVETTVSPGHMLPPHTEQVFVRVEADLGESYTRLQLRLDGLGFRDQMYVLERTQTLPGRWTYNLPGWLDLPERDAEGVLNVTVRFPGNHEETARYVLVRAPPAVPSSLTALRQP